METAYSGSNTCGVTCCSHCQRWYTSGQKHDCDPSVSSNATWAPPAVTTGTILWRYCATCNVWHTGIHYCWNKPSPWGWSVTTNINGWKCPGCGACFGPSVSACTNCKPTPTESDSWPSSLEFADDEKATDEHADELDPEHEKYPESEAFDGMPEPRYSWASLDRRAREMARATRERLGRRG